MKVYYAHCLAIYNTPQEQRDIHLLESLGFEVYNPNCKECADGYKEKGMDFFADVVGSCDVLAFRALPDGRIPAGVAQEISYMIMCAKPIIEFPSGILKRTISVDETREYLKEAGQR